MSEAEIVRDKDGNVVRYKRKRTDEEIARDAEALIASLSDDIKNDPQFDLEKLKNDVIYYETLTNCDTSGVWVSENPDGSVELGYTDFEVPYYDGMDHEFTSRLDKENADKLRAALSKDHKGSLQDMIYEAFTFNNGEVLHHENYEKFCEENGIKHDDYCWTTEDD